MRKIILIVSIVIISLSIGFFIANIRKENAEYGAPVVIKCGYNGEKIYVLEAFNKDYEVARDDQFNKLYIYDLKTKNKSVFFKGEAYQFIDNFLPNPKKELLLYYIKDSNGLYVYNAKMNKIQMTINVKPYDNTVGWLPDGTGFYFCDHKGFQIMQISDGKPYAKYDYLPYKNKMFKCLDWSTDGNSILFKQLDSGNVFIYDCVSRTSKRILSSRVSKAYFWPERKAIIFLEEPIRRYTGSSIMGLYQIKSCKRVDIFKIDIIYDELHYMGKGRAVIVEDCYLDFNNKKKYLLPSCMGPQEYFYDSIPKTAQNIFIKVTKNGFKIGSIDDLLKIKDEKH